MSAPRWEADVRAEVLMRWPLSARYAARLIGITQDTVQRWRREHGIAAPSVAERVPELPEAVLSDVLAGKYRPGDPLPGGPPSGDTTTDAGAAGETAAGTDDGECQETREDEQTPNAWQISMKSRTVCTLEQLLEACQVDLATWEVEKFRCKSYQVTYVPRATRESGDEEWIRPHRHRHAVTLTMYAVSASLKRKVAVIAARGEIASMLADARTQLVRAPLVLLRPRAETGYMLELSIPDLHAGRLAWGRETGGPDYDLHIAERTLHRAVETLLARSSQHRYDKVLAIIGDDLLHADNLEGTTTKGTRVDVDSRHHKVYTAMRQAWTSAIERIVADVAPVHAVINPGNHDEVSTLHLGDSLACWFHASPHVTVDAEPTERKYVEYGQVLLGITHGDTGKPETWVRLMPVEAREAWGRTRYREIHTGHFHKEMAVLDEITGVKVRLLPSLAPPDAWHAQHGFVGNTPAAEAFHWHADDGLVSTAAYYHEYPEATASLRAA